MGLFGKSTSKQTAKIKSLVKLAAARLVVARRRRLGRRSIARGDVGQLLAIGRLDRALARAEQVIDEDNMLAVLDIIELYCKVIIDQAAQLDNPKECSEEIKAAAAGLMFASARLGELPELLDARGILADKFGRDFARAAREGSHGVVDPTLVRKLSGERASEEEKRRLAKEIAAENDILLDFHEKPVQVHQQVVFMQQAPVQAKQSSEPTKKQSEPVKESVEQREVKADRHEAQAPGRQRFVDANVRPGLAQLAVDDKVSRESNKYLDARMAAEAAFESATFAAMAARAAVELSRSQQGKGPRGFDKVHPHPPSPSWSGGSTVTSVGSEKGKGVAFGRSDDDDEEEEDAAWPPQQRRPTYQRAASAMGTGGTRPFQDGNPTHRRHGTELGGGQYVTPPYRRAPTGGGATTTNAPAAAYESAAHAPPPYARIVSALERGKNEHIARHEAVRPMGTDARVMQERVYGAAPAPMNTERRANSVRTRR
ncbi:hypothetical protein PR202_ga26332 [Eleusine coracana subsp. coracana]|uniref:Regulator of Vps4 activity in the MVB pathway protein n=1 Tax=Eleusine coracana subsp. coracana TaxID=191504 RepID=A0AAV5DDK7_ELECO|nr:hypothetical protein QOZ80_3AG0241650 [Eleusine coracana subsp. coracana]GJN08419.1 hypothetical protein PR202_ga26332 [Eleusine coracana subsp. coracana]